MAHTVCSFVTRHLCDWLAGVQQLHPKSQRRSHACLLALEWRLPTACRGYIQGCCRGPVRHPLLRSQRCLLLLCECCILFLFLLFQTYWCSAFLRLLVRLLKSWRKDCTEMERSVLIVILYMMLRMNWLTLIFVGRTFFSGTLLSVNWVLRSRWVLFKLDFVPGNFSSDQNLAISFSDDSVEGKRVFIIMGFLRVAQATNPFLGKAIKSDSARVHTQLACEQRSKRF